MQIPITCTGVRDGEYIVGRRDSKQAAGTLIQIKGFYPPSRAAVAALDEIAIRDLFNTIPFFRDLNPVARKSWLESNATANSDLYLEDVPELKFKFHNISGDYLTKVLSSEQIATLLRGPPDSKCSDAGYWTAREAFDMIPRKLGSRGRKHTLVFRPGNWALASEAKAVEAYTGLHLILDTKVEFGDGPITVSPKHTIIVHQLQTSVLSAETIAIVALKPDDYQIWDLAASYLTLEQRRELETYTAWCTPGVYKSLIQKLIRTRCLEVSHLGKRYPAAAVLVYAFCCLAVHPGAFVPNIQRYVTGLESATKRLAVSINEDSWTDDNLTVTGLYAAALLVQKDISSTRWRPHSTLIPKWLHLAVTAQAEPRAYIYSTQTWSSRIPSFQALSLSYLLLSELRSFKTDITMLGSILDSEGRARESLSPGMAVMPLTHCLDHHVLTAIGHHLDPELVTAIADRDYAPVFQMIWTLVTGINFRVALIQESDSRVQRIRLAQEQLWFLQTSEPQVLEVLPKPIVNFSYRLNPAWLGALVGPIAININTVVILRSRNEDELELVAIKKPNRSSKTMPYLTETEQMAAIAQAQHRLQSGIKLGSGALIPELSGATIQLQDGNYIVHSTDDSKPWSEFIERKYQFPVHPELTRDIMRYSGAGIMWLGPPKLSASLDATNIQVLRRLSLYMRGYQGKIKLYKIGRDGSGTELSVSPLDTAVWHLLTEISWCYPGALQLQKDGFQVINGPLLWGIRDHLNSRLQIPILPDLGPGWVYSKLEARKLWPHQERALNQMQARHIAGNSGHLIWIPVGLGKTLVVLAYLSFLIQRQAMPRYCVYTLPPSAVKTIQQELNLHGLRHHLIDMRVTAGAKSRELIPYAVNLAHHDHLRLGGLDTQLRDCASELMFVIDEFHKTLNATIRTSLALEVASLAYDFVAMSGTIIKDTNANQLINWLALTVEFQVTPENYWVAIGSIISSREETKIVVEREEFEVKFSPEEAATYYKLVPAKLGGTAVEINFGAAVSLCYQVITQGLVKASIMYLQAGEDVMVVAKDLKQQDQLRELLVRSGVGAEQIYCITNHNPLNYIPGDGQKFRVVITTPQHSEGYSLCAIRVMLTSVYFGNQATRDQLEGRINRSGQLSPSIQITTLHCGILSYVLKKHTATRSLAQALKILASEV